MTDGLILSIFFGFSFFFFFLFSLSVLFYSLKDMKLQKNYNEIITLENLKKPRQDQKNYHNSRKKI